MNQDTRLYRSRTDRMLGGVLGGLADRLNTDPALVRIAYTALTLVTGFWIGIALYVVAWIVIPEAPAQPAAAPPIPDAPVPPSTPAAPTS